MKILLVGDVPTHPVRMGNSRLIVDQAQQLKEMGHEIHYLYISNRPIRDIWKGITDRNLIDMKKYWNDELHVISINFITKIRFILRNKMKKIWNQGFIKADSLYYNRIHKKINALNLKFGFDACIVNYYYLSKALTKINIPIKALLTHDIFTYRHIVTGRNNIGSLTPNEEARVMQRSDNILCVQKEDAIYFSKLSPHSAIYTTFTSVKFTETPITNNHNILYLSGNGKFNIEGLYWFVETIFPLIISNWPDSKLIIGGGICNALKDWENHPSIRLVGYVNSPTDFFSLGDIAINPTMNGTGLKIKTMESISYDKITLVHPHSSVGLYDEIECPLFISNDPKEWINYLRLIWNPNSMKLIEVREKNKAYITGLNKHIAKEYQRLLDNKK